jgi:PBP1b-binding outer membrane lipoprotein LpoB
MVFVSLYCRTYRQRGVNPNIGQRKGRLKRIMKLYSPNIVRLLTVLLLLIILTGCAVVTALGTVASTVIMGAEQAMTEPVSRTITHDFELTKKALLVALCKMQIPVEKANEIEHGEVILAKVEDLDIQIELKEITSRVTRIEIKTSNGFMKEDNATAEEIVNQTTHIADSLVT